MLNSQPTSAKDVFRHINKGLTILLWGLIAAYILIITHFFFGYIDHVPYFVFDDAVANISYSVATLGRNGFLLSPLNTGTLDFRHIHFFTHGPWYYMFGGILVWIFGFSFALLRSIHLMSIIGMVVLSFFFFRSVRFRSTAAAFSIAMLVIFQHTHWPMVRADSFGGPLYVLYFILTGLAMQSRKPGFWFLSGIAATVATTNHLMGWSLAPASAVIFGVAAWNQRRETDQPNGSPSILRQFGGLFGGWAVGSFLFLWSIGFKIVELFNAGIAHPGSKHHGSFISRYFEILYKHIDFAFHGIPGDVLWVYAALILSTAMLIGSFWMAQKTRHRVLSLVAPPAIVMFLHLCSRGLFNNFHMGYSILIHVLTFWSLAACATALFFATEKSFPVIYRMGEAGALLASGCIIILALNHVVHAGDARDKYLDEWASFPRYYEEVLGPIPTGARAWGSLVFGVETPKRIQMVQMFEALTLLEVIEEPEKQSLGPDYIIWGFSMTFSHVILTVRGHHTNMVEMERDLGVRYALVSIVNAPPYGVTRVYQRIMDSDAASSPMPIISAFDPKRGQWNRSLGAPLRPSCTSVAPARFELPERFKTPSGNFVRYALQTFSCPLQTGEYLVHVKFKDKRPSGDSRARMLAVSSTKDQSEIIPSDLGPDFDTAPYFLNDRETYLYLRHHEGNAFVSQFDVADGSEIESIEFFPVTSFKDFKEFRKKQAFSPLPPFTEWTVTSPGGKVTLPGQDGWTNFQGDTSPFGYQLTSPTLSIPEPFQQLSRFCARLEFQPITGHVALGVLDKTGNWLLPASTPLSPGLNEICWPFKPAISTQVTLVLANVNRNGRIEGNARFQIRNAQIMGAPLDEPIYTDVLVNKSVEAGLLKKEASPTVPARE